jgi:hypothetical protein
MNNPENKITAKCPVCLSDPKKSSKINSCGHIFCYKCILTWSQVFLFLFRQRTLVRFARSALQRSRGNIKRKSKRLSRKFRTATGNVGKSKYAKGTSKNGRMNSRFTCLIYWVGKRPVLRNWRCCNFIRLLKRWWRNDFKDIVHYYYL